MTGLSARRTAIALVAVVFTVEKPARLTMTTLAVGLISINFRSHLRVHDACGEGKGVRNLFIF